MILAVHLVIGAYGFWLPNDERGSGSATVWATHLRPFGPATKVNTRRSVAGRSFDRAKRDAAKAALLHPAVRFTGEQARAIAAGFGDASSNHGIAIHACAVMPDHTHLVVARHDRLDHAGVTERLKWHATRRLTAERLRPNADRTDRHGRVPTPWQKGGWSVFLDRPVDVERTIRYVEDNPVGAGLRRQRWSFVRPYGA